MVFKADDLSGQRFGRLVALRRAPKPDTLKRRSTFWEVRCDCGRTVIKRAATLKNGMTTSCGCFAKEQSSIRAKTHGMTLTPTYKSWRSMHQRCLPGNEISRKDYADRGIAVCRRWSSFEAFLSDMGKRPNGHTIGRINNDKGYEPGNCRWETYAQQSNNKRNTTLISLYGVEKPITEWSDLSGVSPNTIRHRLRSGRTAEEALSAGDFRSPEISNYRSMKL